MTSLSNFKNPKISDRESFHVRIQTQCSTRVSRVVSDVSSETFMAVTIEKRSSCDFLTRSQFGERPNWTRETRMLQRDITPPLILPPSPPWPLALDEDDHTKGDAKNHGVGHK